MNPTIWKVSAPVPVRPRPPKPERTIESNPDTDRLRQALAAIPNDDVPYDDWFRIACGVHHATDGGGLEVFREWSARSAKHDDDFLESRVWPYIQVERGGDVITADYIIKTAERHGWQDPATLDDFDALPPDTDNPRKVNRWQFVQAASFSAGKPPGWIIKNVLPRAELVVLYGESGSGKSFLALDLMGSIARGVDWRGHKTTQGLRCGYIAAEGAAGFRNRLHAYASHHGIALADMPLAVLAGAPNFAEKADILDLGNAMRAYGQLDVLVVDTLAQVTAGLNENSGEDMGRVIAHCKTLHAVTGATVVLVHHSGKDASRGARGWSGIKGALDAELEVTRSDNDRCVTISKMKDGTGEGTQYGFRLLDVPLGMDEDGEVYGSCVLEYCDRVMVDRKAGPKGKVEIAVHKVVLDLLEGEEVPTVDAVVSEYANRTPHDALAGRDLRRQHAMRALRGLIDKGVFAVDGVRVGLAEGDNS